MKKQILREQMLKKRLELADSFRSQVSRDICNQISHMMHELKGLSVALYSDFKAEVPTDEVFRLLKPVASSISYPRNYSDPDQPIRFYKVSDLDELQPGKYGIPEPSDENEEVKVSDIDVFFVPGVAFDGRGYRVGYGTGCYDRAFSKFNRTPRLFGLAYDFQVVPKVSEELHDLQVKEVITEKRIIQCSN